MTIPYTGTNPSTYITQVAVWQLRAAWNSRAYTTICDKPDLGAMANAVVSAVAARHDIGNAAGVHVVRLDARYVPGGYAPAAVQLAIQWQGLHLAHRLASNEIKITMLMVYGPDEWCRAAGDGVCLHDGKTREMESVRGRAIPEEPCSDFQRRSAPNPFAAAAAAETTHA